MADFILSCESTVDLISLTAFLTLMIWNAIPMLFPVSTIL